jgi:hypothetical protein
VKFEAVWLLSVLSLPHLDVFQRNDPSGLLVRSVLKVVEAVVVQDKPPPLPALYATTLLPQPALFVRVEKGMHQVIAVIFRDFERLCLDALI